MTWAEAEIDCQSQGTNGHLASISSKAEGAVLARHIKASLQGCQHVWIGLHDPQRPKPGSRRLTPKVKALKQFQYYKNRRWRWSDRSIVNYRSWGTGEPSNFENDEYCVELLCDSDYLTWNDQNCKDESPYICEFEL
uniref:Uncharacterized protein n=1 Tax=Sphaerodactylus townsendi TaxID=933632 RepID=A0ACB8FM51_9SAUR